jgi:hypothetical protein
MAATTADASAGRRVREYLVKWTGLGYNDATWEEQTAFDGTIVNDCLGGQVRPHRHQSARRHTARSS